MIDLRRDVFARLVISAHKKQYLNKPFRVRHIDDWKAPKHVSLTSSTIDEDIKSLETDVSKIPFKMNPAAVPASKPVLAVVQTNIKTEKIDEKVDSIINDPVLIELQVELEFAEELLKKVKDTDTHNPKIPLIEETILRLRALLNEKMYV